MKMNFKTQRALARVISCGRRKLLICLCEWLKSGRGGGVAARTHVPHWGAARLIKGQACVRLCCFTAGLSQWKLTIWVHVVPGHLWGGEPLLERVCAVTILIHGDQLLLRRSQRCKGVHHPLHPIGHHLCNITEKCRWKPCDCSERSCSEQKPGFWGVDRGDRS